MADKKGIQRPFQIGPRGIVLVSGEDLRASQVSGVLGIRATTPGLGMGELSWDTSRGSRLDALRNASTNDAFEDVVVRAVEDALAYAMPTERLDAIGGTIFEDTVEVNLETVPVGERGNTQKAIARSTLSFRRST